MAFRQISVYFFLILPLFCWADIPVETFEELFTVHSEKLSYLDEPHPPTAILFSATPGMGKTAISKQLLPYYHAVVISTDEIRRTMKDAGIYNDEQPIKQNEEILHQFFTYFMDRLYHEYPNRFYIMDNSVDRNYHVLHDSLDSYGFQTVLIRLQVSRESVEQRLIEREKNPEYYLKYLDKWFADYEAFDLDLVDIFFDNSAPLNIELLIDAINRFFYNQLNDNERNTVNNTSRSINNETSLSACH